MFGGSLWKVDYLAMFVRLFVGYFYYDWFFVVKLGNLDYCIVGEFLVGGSYCFFVVFDVVGGFFIMEVIVVVGCDVLFFIVLCR